MNHRQNIQLQFDDLAARETREALRRLHHALTYAATFGLGWLCGVLICVGKLKGWW